MRVDELNDETEARMDAMEDRIRALEAAVSAEKLNRQGVEDELARTCAALVNARDAEAAAVKRVEEAEGERVRLESAVTFYRDGRRQEEKSHLQAAAYAEEMKKQVASLRSQLSEAQAREGRLRTDLREWATPPTGMGASLYAETWPALTPSARRRMLRLAALSPSPVSGAAAKEPGPIEDPQPIGTCPRCHVPVYIEAGFCGGCGR